jgi:hypothetical protein
MPQTVIPVVTLKPNNYAVVAGDLNIVPVALDNVNGNSFQATGQEILIFMNTDTAVHTVTITSVPDALGRLDTSITAYTVPVAAGGTSGISAVQMKALQGWLEAGGVVFLATSSALVKVLVLRYQ